MCVVAMAWAAHPRWQLVMVGNRDEFHARPTAPLARWDDPAHVIGGRDLQSGGMWLGVSDQGRFAVVTNLAGMTDPDAGRASRGALVGDWLAGNGRYARLQPSHLSEFNGFNLFSVDSRGAWLANNGASPGIAPLAPGVHSLSNGPPGAPWPRRTHLESALQHWLVNGGDDPESLLAALADESALEAIPDASPHPIFISDETYGTRASTVVAIDQQGKGCIIERAFGPAGRVIGQCRINFAWP